jgi:energy-coupling factor transporter ATP-binding protein EcfA2
MAEAQQTQKDVAPAATRPQAWITAVVFSDGTRIELARHEILVLVGPNNAGKSVALRDLLNKMQMPSHDSLVVVMVEFEIEGDGLKWEESLPRKPSQPDPNYVDLPFGRQHRNNIVHAWTQARHAGLGMLTPLFAILLSTEGRLQAANQVANINFVTEPMTAPLHHVHENDELEIRLSNIVHQAFGHDLIVNRGAGSQIMLHLGSRPIAPGGDRQAATYRQAVNSLPFVQAQGDGIRAFVGILLHTLVLDHDVILIDEPDAFLHPPQAALMGRVLAVETPNPRQLIVATHSTDFLRGVLDAPESPVRVVRVRRKGDQNHVRQLDPESVRNVWRDPLLRYSNVLDGLFHDGVIVCEADGDCRFYNAMMDVVTSEDARPDLLLTHCGGKHRVATVIQSLRAIDVPVRAVLDFDALSEESTLQKIYESFGGNWDEIRPDWRLVTTAIESRRPELPTSKVKEKLDGILTSVTRGSVPEAAIKQIRDVLRGASAWSEAKRMGKAFIPSGEPTAAYIHLADKLRSLGLYLVEVGSLSNSASPSATTGRSGWSRCLSATLRLTWSSNPLGNSAGR